MPLLGSLSASSTCGTTYGPTPVVACADSLPDRPSMSPKTTTRHVFQLLTFTTFAELPDKLCAIVHLPGVMTNDQLRTESSFWVGKGKKIGGHFGVLRFCSHHRC